MDNLLSSLKESWRQWKSKEQERVRRGPTFYSGLEIIQCRSESIKGRRETQCAHDFLTAKPAPLSSGAKFGLQITAEKRRYEYAVIEP